MRSTLALAAAFLVALGTQLPSSAECSCIRRAREDAKRAAAAEALHHLPSQSDLVTARTFAGERMFTDAAHMYLEAADKAEQELSQAKTKAFETPTTINRDAVSYLLYHAADIDEESASFLSSKGMQANEVLNLASSAFQHYVESDAMDANEKVNKASELAAKFENANQPVSAAKYFKVALDELQASKGRYCPEVIAMQQHYRKLLASVQLTTK